MSLVARSEVFETSAEMLAVRACRGPFKTCDSIDSGSDAAGLSELSELLRTWSAGVAAKRDQKQEASQD